MLVIGVALAVVAVILIILGVASQAVTWLLWLGIGLVIVSVVLIFLDRRSGRRIP
jgi:hypothetical protein